MRFGVLVFALALAVVLVGPANGLTVPESPKFLVIDSEPGDFVGQGQQLSFSADTATFEAFQFFGSQVIIRVFPNTGGFWVIHFSAPEGEQLAPGVYEDTQRTGGPGHAGLDIGGNGRGCNIAFGRFIVNEAVFDGLFSPVLSFDALRATAATVSAAIGC